MPSTYPSRSPASMPAARTVRLARRLASGMTPAEVAKHEGTDEAELLSLLADERFQEHVAYYRLEAELPEDEREALLIRTAFASLQHLADMGDTKALLFLTYEGNRGRHPGKPPAPPRDTHERRDPDLCARDEIGARRPRGRSHQGNPSPPSLSRTSSPSPGATRTWPTGSCVTPRAATPRWERAGPGRWRSKKGE